MTSTTTGTPSGTADAPPAAGRALPREGRFTSASELGVGATLRRAAQVSPELVQGIWLTLLLAVLAAGGRVLVPVAVQQVVDGALLADGGPDLPRVWRLLAAAAVGLLVAGACTTAVNGRLIRRAEAGLRTLRVAAFDHVHRLSVLTQGTERRGALVSRVTSDVDTISLFVQWGGLMLLVSVLQVTVATVLMAVYSWQLTLVVWCTFVPLAVVLHRVQPRVNRRYTRVRERYGAMLAAVSEAVVGAETIRAYGVADRTERTLDARIEDTRAAQVRAQNLVATVFSSGTLVATGVLAVVVVVGTVLAARGDLTVGALLAFLFLVQLFTQPVQMATEILSELQNAVAGWRRVLGVLETEVDVPEPTDDEVLPTSTGPGRVELRGVSYGYPGGPTVLHGVDLDVAPGSSVAVVGTTGSGKTTIARLVARFVDPREGQVLLDGVDVRRLRDADLRRRVVLVPQEGYLFDGTLAQNVADGLRLAADAPDGTAPGPDDPRVVQVLEELGLGPWVAGLPAGVHTPVGQRGEAMSAGERQLVALARAHAADADVLVLDEATSAVDPATEVAIARALARLTAGRTTVTIAHRLSTAEGADQVVVVDAGRVVEHGPHARLVAAGGRYAALHAAWVAQTR
ncbi:multidrug ABC transporter ATP-binding protein [Cellulomonas marina]|uniref:ABC-type multidrug transport system, ATPase and permease component n=1 Tax=Cellulomonas marina TaxID=988821 RepID=A0A1I0ZPL4_9CELL|nr:multidrug ABC transporter ATP-binding protein [Cellulomonas marina]SFB27457.1 ABC-type multidrug transport system, ATPase and permease component [Cellulomonas marina]